MTRANSPYLIHRANLLDEGSNTAIYPYTQLHEIQRPEDVRIALLDETRALEDEFGRETVQPLYDLVWTINGGAGVFTSHTAIAPPTQPPPYDWAKHYVAVALIILSRDQMEHTNGQACHQSVDELGRLLAAAKPPQDATGWYLSVGPCNVIYTSDMDLTTFQMTLPSDTRGYGTQLIIGGAGSNRRTAATRWHYALTHTSEVIRQTQHGENRAPASPHRHVLPGTHPSHDPTS